MKVKFGPWLVLALLSLTLTLAGCGGSTVSSGTSHSVSLTAITVTPSATSVPFGTMQQMTATGHFSDGTSRALTSGLTWSSSATTVATVSGSGSVTPVQHGQTTITAAQGSINGSTTLTITTALASIAVTPGAPGVFVGSSLQLKATGNNDDGTTLDLTSSATWTSSDTSNATVSAGLAAGLHGGQTMITAALGSVSGNANLTVTALLQSMLLNPIGPGVQVGGSQQFTALGSFNDATTKDLTATASWSSSDATKATVGAGLATGVARGAVTVTVTGTSANGSNFSASTALDVVDAPSIPPSLNGNYAFTLVSADTRGPQFFAGSFTADGAGHITTGVEDTNTAAGVLNDALTGSYVIYPDGRGDISFAPNAIHPLGITLRFILAANAGTPWSLGKLVQFDGNGTAKGTLDMQDPTQFSLSGTYVFRASGIDSGTQPFDNGAPQPMGQVGIFTVDGSGGVTAGTVDTNDFGNLSVFVPFVPSPSSSYSVDSSGRGTLTLATASGTSNFVMYVIDSQHINFIATDSLPSLLGRAESQSAQTFTASNLNGGYAFLVDRPVVVGVNGFDRREFAQVGAYRFDGVGGPASVTGARDDTNNTDNNGTNLNPLVDITGGYSVTATGGRGTFDARSNVQGSDRGYVFYMLSDDKMFLLQTVNFSNGTFNAPTGVAEKQTGGPYGDATLTGDYALDASDLTATYTEALMRISFDGSGGVAGIADVSASSTVSSAVISADLNPAPGPSTGRGGITLTDQVGARNYVFYLVSPQKAWVLGVTPPEVGSILQQ